ncbi:hypothetical protein C8R44DRAFT_863470 [Mycena epipterygia]|nr:hypothetical protein C8R44DRAFT_863470 [Mycena epipterygia]
MPGVSWTPERFKNYWQLYHNIYQCEKEVKMIQVAVKITVEAEFKRKYTEDIRETEAIVTAVLDPRGTVPHSCRRVAHSCTRNYPLNAYHPQVKLQSITGLEV